MGPPPVPYPTASLARGENPRLRRGGTGRMVVSAWDARRRSAKTPRNRGDFSGCARVRAGSLCNSRLVGGANGIRTCSIPCGANQERNRTAQLGDREKHGLRCLPGPEPAVSGSDRQGLDGQDPAESRGFLRLCPSVRGKSLQQQTGWRREWDSNPRYLSVHTLSKRAPSAARPSLRAARRGSPGSLTAGENEPPKNPGGEGGIRTLGRVAPTQV